MNECSTKNCGNERLIEDKLFCQDCRLLWRKLCNAVFGFQTQTIDSNTNLLLRMFKERLIKKMDVYVCVCGQIFDNKVKCNNHSLLEHNIKMYDEV